MNQVKLREQVVGRGAAVSLSQLVTQPPEGKPVRDCQRLTHERFVMGFFFLTECDSLFFTAVHQEGGVSLSVKEATAGGWTGWMTPPHREWVFRLLFTGRIKEKTC